MIFISIQVSRVTIRLERWFHHLLWRRILQWKGPIFLSWCIKFRYEWLWEVNFLTLTRSIRKKLFAIITGVDFPNSQQCFSNRSMIITGCSKWTLYEHSHFNGQSACWQPRDNCAPAFFRDEKLMKGWAQRVSSVRRGCYSEKTFYGEPLPFERSADNSTIGSSGHVFGNWYTIQCFWTSPFSDLIIWFTL